jgi:hypothetical protein
VVKELNSCEGMLAVGDRLVKLEAESDVKISVKKSEVGGEELSRLLKRWEGILTVGSRIVAETNDSEHLGRNLCSVIVFCDF